MVLNMFGIHITLELLGLNSPHSLIQSPFPPMKDTLELRHYVTRVAEGGLSKNIKKILQKKAVSSSAGG